MKALRKGAAQAAPLIRIGAVRLTSVWVRSGCIMRPSLEMNASIEIEGYSDSHVNTRALIKTSPLLLDACLKMSRDFSSGKNLSEAIQEMDAAIAAYKQELCL